MEEIERGKWAGVSSPKTALSESSADGLGNVSTWGDMFQFLTDTKLEQCRSFMPFPWNLPLHEPYFVFSNSP